MTEFEVRCPHCQCPLMVQEDWIGAEAACPECQQNFIIRNNISAPKAKLGNSQTFTFICPECDTVADLPYSAKGQKYTCKECCETTIAEPAVDRKCPHCGEKIKIKAEICKYCKKTVKPLTPSTATVNIPAGKEYWGITEAEAGSLRNIGNWLLYGVVFSMILPFLVIFVPSVGLMNFAASIGVFVLFCIWIHKLWEQIPAAEAETTPGKAVWFIFIPIYDIYWLIMMPWRLSKHYDRYDDSKFTVSIRWLIYLGFVAFSFLMSLFFSFNDSVSGADADAAAEFFGTTANHTAARLDFAAFMVTATILRILNSAIFMNWIVRVQKCLQKIPQIG